MECLSTEEEALINALVLNQERHELPSVEDLQKVTDFSLGAREEDYMKRSEHVTEVIILTVNLIVDFAKGVPGFKTLFPEDQITLLKACSIEVMLLRLARQYDPETNSTTFGNNRRYTKEDLCAACMGGFSDYIFDFCRKMYSLKVNDSEYALLTVIAIFSERPLLIEVKKVEKLRERYTEVLRAYTGISRHAGNDYCDQLLSTLADLGEHANKNSEQWLSNTVYHDKLAPFFKSVLGHSE